MKVLLLMIAFISFNTFANCPTADFQRKNPWRLYEGDQERELWSCKLSKSEEFSRLEFCTGRIVSNMPIGEYIGLGGIEQWKKEYYPTNLMSTHPMWISFVRDNEGEAQDTAQILSLIHRPLPDIMSNHQYRYSFNLDKKSGKARYAVERKKHPCVFCGGWKLEAQADLNCKLTR